MDIGSNMVNEDELWKELEAARKELRLLKAENYELKEKVAEFECNIRIIRNKGGVNQCKV